MKDWESAYVNDETPWDKGAPSPPLREFLSKHAILQKVLVPGCGSGHDVRLLAGQGASVVGLDLAPSAVRKAGAFEAVNEERYVTDDFLNLADEFQGEFDWVVEHTCLCAIDPSQRSDYAIAVNQALIAGGHFLAIFFREVSNYTGEGPPHPISEEQIIALFSENFERVDSFVPTQTYPSRSFGDEEVVLFRKR